MRIPDDDRPDSSRPGRLAIRGLVAPAIWMLLVIAPLACQGERNIPLVSFRHLEHLTEEITLAGDSVSIVHVYANYPDYEWVDAKESGPEGIACVDDAARAAVLYLRDFELNRRSESLVRARKLLGFVLAMQDSDGQFYNFVFENHAINRDGRTSFRSFGWWAARAVWGIGHGYRVFKEADPAFATLLAGAMERSLPHVSALLARYGQTETAGGFRIPQWLLYESGADATSEMVLGLVEYYRAAPTDTLRTIIRRLADGLVAMQDGDMKTYPFGMFRSWRTMWHMWGNSQTQALAAAGKALGDEHMIVRAQREADGFYSRLLCEGLFKEMDLRIPASRVEFEQIAYSIRPMVVGLVRLYEATGNHDYLRLAGLSASWFFGNNAAGTPMYDPSTGRCYDGLKNRTEVNRNSGAESTIEALNALVELEPYPEAMKYIRSRKVSGTSMPASISGTFELPGGTRFTLHIDLEAGRFSFE